MLIEIYLFIEVVALIFFFLSWFQKNPITWAISIVLFGIQMIAGFNIEYLIFTATDSGIVQTTVGYSSLIAYVNMLFFAMSLIMLFWDIFTERL